MKRASPTAPTLLVAKTRWGACMKLGSDGVLFVGLAELLAEGRARRTVAWKAKAFV